MIHMVSLEDKPIADKDITDEIILQDTKAIDVLLEEAVLIHNKIVNEVSEEAAGFTKLKDAFVGLFNKFLDLMKALGKFISKTFRKIATNFTGNVALDPEKLYNAGNEFEFIPLKVSIHNLDKETDRVFNILSVATDKLLKVTEELLTNNQIDIRDRYYTITNTAAEELGFQDTKNLPEAIQHSIFGVGVKDIHLTTGTILEYSNKVCGMGLSSIPAKPNMDNMIGFGFPKAPNIAKWEGIFKQKRAAITKYFDLFDNSEDDVTKIRGDQWMQLLVGWASTILITNTTCFSQYPLVLNKHKAVYVKLSKDFRL